eukprot:scaffold14815_cov53-Phaeocystis_antarctica.AAC.6
MPVVGRFTGQAGGRVSSAPGASTPRADTHTRVLYTRHKSSRRGPPCSWIHKTTLLAPGGPPPVRAGHGSSSCDDA